MKFRANCEVAVLGVLLVVAVVAGFHATGGSNRATPTQNVSVEACEELPEYDYARMLSRVEEIKGMQMRRNLTLCTERATTGIDTTPDGGRFARVGKSGLAFFGLDADANSKRRSSLGHTEFSPSGGPIAVFLANESVVENVSWISYEALVAHELSDAIAASASTARSSRSSANGRATVPRTTDAILARQALSNGVSLHVSKLYVQRHGGRLNVSGLHAGDENWKRRVVQSAYYFGYRYSERSDRRTVREATVLNSTAGILHPNETRSVGGALARPKLSTESLVHVRTDRVGELFLRATFESKGVRPERATVVADGWTNDRMDYYRANGSSVVTWRVQWRSAGERAEFVETYTAVYDYERVNSLRSVGCGESGRYLVAAEKTVTVVRCSGRR